MFAGAAYSDQADIQHEDAVNMLTSLGVLGGYPDGTFRPDATITRAEMAKMIYTIRNGGDSNADQYKSLSTSFTDIDGHWAEGYIKYCQTLGIISGKSATRFDPSGDVTVAETAKMALVMMGYNASANRANLVGSGWDSRTLALATDNGLMDSIYGAVNSAISRDEAAQMLYNTVNTKCVIWSNDKESFVDDTYTVGTGRDAYDKAYTVGTKFLGLQEWIGTFKGDDKMSGAKEGQITVYGSIDGQHKSSSEDKDAKNASFKYDFSNSYVGEEVSVLFKDGKNGTAEQPDDNDTIYGVYVTGNTTVYNITKGDLQDADANKIKFGDKQYKVADADSKQGTQINVYTNYKSTSTAEDVSKFDKGGDYYKDSADTIKFIEEDGEITAAYIVETQFAEIVSINSTKLSLSGGVNKAGLVIEDNDVYEGAAKNDIVAVQVLYDDDYYVITKANIVEADVSASKSLTEVRIDGNYVKKCETTGTEEIGDYDLFAINDLGETYEFIMYGNYWVAAQQTTESAKDYAVVDKIDANYTNAVSPSVKLVKADGSTVTVAIDSDSDDDIKTGMLVKYKTNNDGSVEMVSAEVATTGNALKTDTLSVINSVGSFNYNKNTKQITFGDGSKYATTADCVAFIEYENGKYMVASADEMSTFSATAKTAVYVSLDKDGKVVAYKVVTSGKPSSTTSDEVYGYITSRGSEKIGDDTYVMLDVWTAGGNVTLKTEDLSSAQESALVAGAFIKFKAGADVTNAADIATVTVKKVRVDAYDADRQLLTQKDGTQWPVADDVALITIDYSEKEGVEDQYDFVPTYDSEADTCNAAIVVDEVDGVNTVVAVYIDIDSDMGK